MLNNRIAITGKLGKATRYPEVDELVELAREVDQKRSDVAFFRGASMKLMSELAQAYFSVEQGLALAKVYQKYAQADARLSLDGVVERWERLRARFAAKGGESPDPFVVEKGPAQRLEEATEDIVEFVREPNYTCTRRSIRGKKPRAIIQALASPGSKSLARALNRGYALMAFETFFGRALLQVVPGPGHAALAAEADGVLDGSATNTISVTLTVLASLGGNAAGPASLSVAAFTLSASRAVDELKDLPASELGTGREYLSRVAKAKRNALIVLRLKGDNLEAFNAMLDELERVSRKKGGIESDIRSNAAKLSAPNKSVQATARARISELNLQLEKADVRFNQLNADVRERVKSSLAEWQAGPIAGGAILGISMLQLVIAWGEYTKSDRSYWDFGKLGLSVAGSVLVGGAGGIQIMAWGQRCHGWQVRSNMIELENFANTPKGQFLGKLIAWVAILQGLLAVRQGVVKGQDVKVATGIAGAVSGAFLLLSIAGGPGFAIVGTIVGLAAAFVDVLAGDAVARSNAERVHYMRAKAAGLVSVSWNGKRVVAILEAAEEVKALDEAIEEARVKGHLRLLPRFPPGTADFSDDTQYLAVLGELVNDCLLARAAADELIEQHGPTGAQVDRGEGT